MKQSATPCPWPGESDGLTTIILPSAGCLSPAEVLLTWGSFAPSIGSERKTYFSHRRRFFDPGVCSRSGGAVSS
jgi:hypothetical protein